MMCPKCKIVELGDEKFCRFDGAKLIPHTKNCPHCKAKIWHSSNFCEQCGKPTK